MSLVAFVCFSGIAHSRTGRGNFDLFLEEREIQGVSTTHVGLEPLRYGEELSRKSFEELINADLIVNCRSEELDRYIRQVNQESPILYYAPYTCPLDEEQDFFKSLVNRLGEQYETQY